MVTRGLKEESHANTTGQACESDKQTSSKVATSIGVRDRFISLKLVNQDDADDESVDGQDSRYDDGDEAFESQNAMSPQSEPSAVGRGVGRTGARQEDGRRGTDGVQKLARHDVGWICCYCSCDGSDAWQHDWWVWRRRILRDVGTGRF